MGGLVGDDLQRRTEAAGVVAWVDDDQGLTGRSAVREPFLCGRSAQAEPTRRLSPGPSGRCRRRRHVARRRVAPSIGGQVGRTHRRVHRVDSVLAEVVPLDRQVEAGGSGVNRHTLPLLISSRTHAGPQPITLVACEPAVGHPVRTSRICSQSLDLVFLVSPEVSLEPEPFRLVARVAFPGQDVGTRAVQKPAVVGDHHSAARELLQGVLQRGQRFGRPGRLWARRAGSGCRPP